MKFTIVFISFFLFALPVFSQNNWVEMMEDPSYNFYDVKNAFEDYWQNRTIEKGKGWKQFKRWEYFTEKRVFPSGDRTQMNNAYIEYRNFLEANPQQRSLSGQWTYIGNNFVPVAGGAGRVNCIAFHPDNTSIIFAGTPAGGLWRTNDGGATWSTNTDDLASMGVSSIVIHPTQPDTMYIGTGDGDGGDTYSVGVLKSIDGGQTFQTTGLNFNYNAGYTIRKLLMNPSDPEIILAATDEGIYRTTDGGANWNQITAYSTFDIEFKPGDPQTVYAGTGGKFWKSTDGGITFTQITDGLPASGMTRLALGVTPANTSVVYILAGNMSNGFYGVYRSSDSGTTFSLQADSPNLLGWDVDGTDSDGQAWYDLAIVVSPSNSNVLWTGGVNVWKSTNAGVNWQIDAHWYGDNGNPYVHADVHAMEFIPGSTNSFLIGCDGGIFKTTNSGTSYSDISNNLKIAQIYEFSLSATDPLKMISGWQDNGTNLKTSIAYRKVLGGDGMDCAIDYTDDQTMYGEYYYGHIYKSTDNGFNFNDIVQSGGTGGTVDEDGEWVTPFILHPMNPNTILVGKTNVYRSTNGGNSWSTVGSVPGGSGMLIKLAYAPSDPDYIYALKRNKVFLSTNGSTFTDVTSNLPTAASLTSVTVDPNDPLRAWVTYSGYNSTTKVFYTSNGGTSWSNYSTGLPNMPLNCIVYQNGTNDGLYVGTDMGVFYRDASHTSWQYYSDGLPNTIVNDLEIYYPTGKLRAATYGRGIWESDLFTNVENDASIALVEIPKGYVCNTTFSPVITLKNSGDNDLTSAEINYSFDAGSPFTYSWNGLLHAGEEIVLTLPVTTMSTGAHGFEIYTSQPNGNSDGNTSNDTLQTSFDVVTNGNIFSFVITPDCFGEEISWEIVDGASQTVAEVFNGEYEGNLIDPAVGGMAITENICLPAACYTFTIRDTEGNGMDGQGSGCTNIGTYDMYDQSGTLVFSDPTTNGDFGATEVHNFCVTYEYVANFSATPTEICSGTSIQFNDLSPAGTNSWNWTFQGGNPSSSNLQNPVVTYDSAGIYNVTLQSGNGTDSHTQTFSGYIVVNDDPDLDVVFDQLLCFGDCNANVDLDVYGGTLPLYYEWSNGEITQDLSNLCEGIYSVMVMDDNGCRDSLVLSINSPAQINLGLNVTQASCGLLDGEITSNVTGGMPPYDLLWSTGDNGTMISGIGIGAYTLTVTDSNDCVVSQPGFVTNPNAPDVIASSVDETCGGECDGSIQSFASGGNGTLSYLWDNSMGSADSIEMVCPGTYIISVTDVDFCEDRDTVLVAAGTPYPNANFTISDTTVGVGQNVNFINLSSGANQHTWSFGDGDSAVFSSTSHTYDSLGTYEVVLVSCKNGCCDSDTGYVYVIDVSSVEENTNDRVKIYPNPTKDVLYVEILQASIPSSVKIYDNNGRLIVSKNSSDKLIPIDISDYSQGIYFVEVNFYDAVLRFKVFRN